MNRRSAFTLAEILVAVGILLLLSAIVYPIASRSILSAKESHGIQKMRQIHLAHMLYQADHGGGGTYGQPSEVMGLPAHWWYPPPLSPTGDHFYPAAPYGMNRELHLAPCAPSAAFPNDIQFYLSLYDDPGVPPFPEVARYKENFPVAIHRQCTQSNDDFKFKRKRSSAVLLSGRAVIRAGYGDPISPDFYADPMD